MGRGAPSELLGCPPELVFQPHFLKIVVEVKALGLPHVLRLCLGKQFHAPRTILSLKKASFCVS